MSYAARNWPATRMAIQDRTDYDATVERIESAHAQDFHLRNGSDPQRWEDPPEIEAQELSPRWSSATLLRHLIRSTREAGYAELAVSWGGKDYKLYVEVDEV